MKYLSLMLLVGVLLVSPPLLAQNTKDDLTVYVERLKASQANGGSETAFMSVGSDFMYAQEYFEAKNYSSAASGFLAILRKEKDHVFANYQLGIALIRQNDPYKAQQAQEYLHRAFELNPSLRERYALDVPAAKDTVAESLPAQQRKTAVAKIEVTAPTPDNAEHGLDSYINKLKHSYATGGKETQMFTPGQEAIAGIQYYEKGEFDSAESRFSLSLAVDAESPYTNYLMAVSLSAQGKVAAAKPFYQKAISGDAALQTRYTEDVAAAKAKWDKLQAAKVVKASPAKEVTYGGSLVYGDYTCDQSIWNGPNASPAYRYDYKGYFTLKKDGTYRWLDDGGTGRYSYNANTGVITWLSGPMKSKAPKSSKYQPGTKVAQISVSFSENYNWECGCNRN